MAPVKSSSSGLRRRRCPRHDRQLPTRCRATRLSQRSAAGPHVPRPARGGRLQALSLNRHRPGRRRRLVLLHPSAVHRDFSFPHLPPRYGRHRHPFRRGRSSICASAPAQCLAAVADAPLRPTARESARRLAPLGRPTRRLDFSTSGPIPGSAGASAAPRSSAPCRPYESRVSGPSSTPVLSS